MSSTPSAAARRPDAGPGARHGPAFFTFLLFTSLVCGSHVMAIEVLGARVIGPYFGVSLFVWTSLITVTLVALATGYALGGWWADLHPEPDWLYGLILAAGLAVLAVPPLRQPVLQACLHLGVRAGALVSAMVLFGPALFLLGCVSPYVVRIAVGEMGRLGRLVGLISAISTGGSFLGTVLTGFVLVTTLSLGLIFNLIGVLLVALAALWFVAFRRRWLATAPLLLALVVLALPEGHERRAKTLADGTVATELLFDDGYYSQLRVVEFRYGEEVTRELYLDSQLQGGLDVDQGLSVYGYAYGLQQLPWALHPGGRRALVVGLGAGLVPRWYGAMGVPTDVAELDPAVVDAARRFFGYRPTGQVLVEDARFVLNTTTEAYDYVLLDVFSGDTTPGHVLSLEALRLAARAMTPDGVLATNLIGRLGRDGVVIASVVRTMREVFDTVEIHPLFDPTSGAPGNVTVVAYRGPPRAPRRDLVDALPVSPLVRGQLDQLWTTYQFPAGTSTYVLTDDYQPTDALDLEVKEEIRARISAGRGDWDMAL
jgi:spermidine synthase